MTTEYLSRAELYHAACAGRPLPENFAASMRWWMIRDEQQVPNGRANVKSSPKDVALRAAVGLAEEWRGLAEASRELGQEEEAADKSEYLLGMISGQNHQATYCANMLLRHLAQELYRDYVPMEERVL